MTEFPERLTSWTRTLNEDDALDLLDTAHPGQSLEEWAELAHAGLPQAGRRRRAELVKIVREELLDHDGTLILASPFLNLLHAGSPHRRRGLLYGRRMYGRPLVGRTIEELMLRALRDADEPLAPFDAGTLSQEDWDTFLRRTLRPDTGPESFEKTRTNLQKNFARAGVLEISGSGVRTSRVQRSEPDPIAFCWLVGHEMRRTGRMEALESWVVQEAFAARLFLPRPDYVRGCLEAGVSAGLLRRGYLAGIPRLHRVEETV